MLILNFGRHVRDVGMSWATATTWCFDFVIAFAWPSMLVKFTPVGGFGWYAAWCAVLWVLTLFFMPEVSVESLGPRSRWKLTLTLYQTKALTLEELDQVFSVPTWKHARYQLKNSMWHVRRYVFFNKNQEPLPPLYTGVEKLSES